MSISPIVIFSICLAIIMPIAMWFMKNIKSFEYTASCSSDLDQYKKAYIKLGRMAVFLLIVLSAIFGYSVWKLMYMLYTYRISYIGQSIYMVPLTESIWIFPSMYIALLLSVIAIHYLYLLLLGKDKYLKYNEYENWRSGLNSWKLAKYIIYTTMPILIIIISLLFGTYTRITERSINVNTFLGINEIEYRFCEMNSIELVRTFETINGDVCRVPFYSIRFKDGSRYDFHADLYELDFHMQTKAVEFISKSSNVDIVTVALRLR